MNLQLRLTYLWEGRGVIAEAVDGDQTAAIIHLPYSQYWSPNPSYSMQTVKRKLIESIGDPVKRFVVERGLQT